MFGLPFLTGIRVLGQAGCGKLVHVYIKKGGWMRDFFLIPPNSKKTFDVETPNGPQT